MTTTRSCGSARPPVRPSPSRSRSPPSSTERPTTRSPWAGRPTRTASSAAGRRGTSRPTRPTRSTWRSSGRTCATARRQPGRPVRRQDQLRRDRQPVHRTVARPGRHRRRSRSPATSSSPGAPTTATAGCGSARSTAAVTPANHLYDYSLATETAPGSLTFTTAPVTTVRSDPTRADRWFAATLNPAFPARDVIPRRLQQHRRHGERPRGRLLDGHAQPATFAGVTGHGEDAYFAAAP